MIEANIARRAFVRIQYRRGHALPVDTCGPTAKLIARPSRWGNPYRISDGATVFARANAMAHYWRWLAERLLVDPDFLEPLRGFDLACYCPEGLPCHGDVILDELYGAP